MDEALNLVIRVERSIWVRSLNVFHTTQVGLSPGSHTILFYFLNTAFPAGYLSAQKAVSQKGFKRHIGGYMLKSYPVRGVN